MTEKTLIQPAITGYRQLSQIEADLMNEIKSHGVKLGLLVEKLRTYTNGARPAGASLPLNLDGSQVVLDQRWVSIGATDLQTGLMALTRAVVQALWRAISNYRG